MPPPHNLLVALLAVALGSAQGCEGFRELPLTRAQDAATDRPDGDATRPRDVADASDAPDAADVPDVSMIVDAGPCGGQCTASQTCCDGRCVDLAADPLNCGSCASTCAAPNATSVCRTRQCVIEVCRPGFSDCDSNALNGCEVEVTTSVSNCGACRVTCGSAGTRERTCDTGRCQLACQGAAADCDNDPANGCEVNTYSDPLNCNRCGNRCAVNHNTPGCYNGLCDEGVCEPGWADCNASPRDGCEAHVAVDVLNCGACGNVCRGMAGMTATCAAGVCGTAAVTCAAPRAECDGVVSPMSAQCETDVSVAAAHCGRCGNACSTSNATASCVRSACVLSCNPGFGDCDGMTATGCETNLQTSATSCGACGRACNLPNATASACVGGACVPAICDSRFGDCDRMPANGCETDTRASVAHCGTCDRTCPVPNGTPACQAGLCAVGRCNMGFGDCDRNAANGCEVDLSRDPRHCRACGQMCPPLWRCAGGNCTL